MSGLNAGDETPRPDRDRRPGQTSIRLLQFGDAAFPGVRADRDGDPADFSRSPELAGATNLGLAGQGPTT